MITDAGRRIGGTFVGWPKDIDVSALKTSPWERPELLAWLERPDAWDVMIWQRLDRAVRSMADMADLGRYAKQHGKRLVFASGPGGAQLELDFASPMSELIMLILAFAAQLEGQTIMERTQGTAQYLQSLGRWSGGVLPYGYQASRRTFPDGNEGWWLIEHPETAAIRREMIRRAIAGESYSAITAWLNESGAVTPMEHRAKMAERDVEPHGGWKSTAVRSMLRSPIARGHVVKRNGETVRNADGSPVMQGDPLIDDATWYTLVAALKKREVPELQQPRRRDAHPLLGVLVCAECGQNMHVGQRRQNDGSVQKQFRCNGGHSNRPTIPQAETIQWVAKTFVRRMGRMRLTEEVQIPGVDYTDEIAELKAEIGELTNRLARMRGAAADAMESQIAARSDRVEMLSAIPVEPPRVETRQLNQTVRDVWEGTQEAGQRVILLDFGVRVEVGPPTGWRRPVSERLEMFIYTNVDHSDPSAALGDE
ncbi:recombinase family protein [Streptomyces synnematoformans]|uniref:Recombinase family protein n=2 Tax=Streptomyces synnematoformans TaxID=415721 RepID=A0ABN2YWI1_9ACTN